MVNRLASICHGAPSGEALGGLLRERDVAALLNVSVGWLRKRRCLGLPPVHSKFGKSVRYSENVVRRFIEQNTRGAGEAA